MASKTELVDRLQRISAMALLNMHLRITARYPNICYGNRMLAAARMIAGSWIHKRRPRRVKSPAMESEMAKDEAPNVGFTIYRAKDAPGLMEAACMSIAPRTDIQAEGLKKVMAAGYGEGEQCKVLVSLPGFSLTHAWMKTEYPLTLHSHDSDCLYFIVAGDLKLGTEELGPKDCFFVPAGVPYTYKPGPNGVEVLEFRHENQFNFVNFSKNAAFYDKAADTCAANLETWRTAKPPSQMA